MRGKTYGRRLPYGPPTPRRASPVSSTRRSDAHYVGPSRGTFERMRAPVGGPAFFRKNGSYVRYHIAESTLVRGSCPPPESTASVGIRLRIGVWHVIRLGRTCTRSSHRASCGTASASAPLGLYRSIQYGPAYKTISFSPGRPKSASKWHANEVTLPGAPCRLT